MTTSPRRVLVVDDDVTIAAMLSAVLQTAGHHATIRVDRLADLIDDPWDYDVALIDMMLPGITGITLMHAARAQNPTIRLIALTAAAEAYAEQAYTVADDVLPKPSPIELIVASVEGRT